MPAEGTHLGAIAVTGGAGFIGSAVVRRGLAAGHDVVSLVRASEQTLVADGVRRLVVDWGDAGAVRDALTEVAGSAIVHCAGAGSRSVGSPADLYEANVGITARLLDGVGAVCPQARVVLLSSAAVYGPEAVVPADELAPLDPRTHYGWSKALMEELARAYSAADSLHPVIARPFNVAGVGEPEGSVIHSILTQIVAAPAEGPVRIVLRETASVRDFVDVDDVAEALVLLAGGGSQDGVFNVCTGRGTNVRDLVHLASEVTGRRLEVDVLEPWAPGTVSVGSPTLLAALGWKARRSLEDSLRRACGGLGVTASGADDGG